MRQDAVMEQVFDLVNIALRRDRETKRRSLNVRTYCVLPLAEQAGILEFVQNTKPLNDVLQGLHRRYTSHSCMLEDTHHHCRYRPLDINGNDFSVKMKEKREKYGRAPVAELTRKMRELWNALKPRLRPVMRHWFTEEHKVRLSFAHPVVRLLTASPAGSYVMVRDAAQLRAKPCYDERRRPHAGARGSSY